DLKNLKQELEVEARLERSIGAGAVRETATADAMARTTFGSAHPTSSAEYLVSEIKRHKRGFFIAAATLTIAVVAVGYFYFAAKSRFAASSEVIDSVAVLPFVNVSGDPNAEYLSDGISDSVINSLSQLPNLKK